MLLGNYSILNRNTVTLSGTAFTNPMARFKATVFDRDQQWDTALTTGWDRASWPNGYGVEGTGGSAWWMAPKSGGMASSGIILGVASLSGSMAQGINISGSAAGSASVTAGLSSVVGLVSSIAGVGSVTAALVGTTQMVAALAGVGSVSAGLGALAFMVGSIAGTGSMTADLKGKSFLEASITTLTDLSPENLAAAVWNATAASYNESGSMGEKLNDAGSGSNPWTEVIEGSYTAAELLRIMSAALAGELSGAGTTTIVIKGVDGTTDRITATVSTRGDRTDVTLDGA